jgi:hypothetical protein
MYIDLTTQQLTAVSDERKEIAKLAGTLLHDGALDRQALAETLRKVTTEEHGQSLEILRPAAEKGREAVSPASASRQGSAASSPKR